MDNRTERQRFEDATQDAHGLISNPWDVWQLAKHDAKPVVEIHTTHYVNASCYAVFLDGKKLNAFWNEGKAEYWIKANGYRLK